jgi:hypothetical protein
MEAFWVVLLLKLTVISSTKGLGEQLTVGVSLAVLALSDKLQHNKPRIRFRYFM